MSKQPRRWILKGSNRKNSISSEAERDSLHGKSKSAFREFFSKPFRKDKSLDSQKFERFKEARDESKNKNRFTISGVFGSSKAKKKQSKKSASTTNGQRWTYSNDGFAEETMVADERSLLVHSPEPQRMHEAKEVMRDVQTDVRQIRAEMVQLQEHMKQVLEILTGDGELAKACTLRYLTNHPIPSRKSSSTNGSFSNESLYADTIQPVEESRCRNNITGSGSREMIDSDRQEEMEESQTNVNAWSTNQALPRCGHSGACNCSVPLPADV